MKSVQRLTISIAVGLTLGGTLGSLLFLVFSSEELRSPEPDSGVQHSSQFVDTEVKSEENQEPQTLRMDKLWFEDSQSNNLKDISTLVANADRNQLQTMFDQVSTTPWTPRISVFIRLLLGNLAQVAPSEALDRVWKFSAPGKLELVDVVFREWSTQNVQEALTSAGELNQPYRDVAFNAIISEQDSLTPINAGEYPFSDALKSFLDKREAEVVILGLMQDPTKAALQLVNDDIADREQIALLDRIVEAWQPDMGFEILNILLDQLYSTDTLLAKDLVVRVITADPASAVDHVTSGKQVKRTAMLGRLLIDDYWSEIGALPTMVAAQALEDLGWGNVYFFEFLDVWGAEDPVGVLDQLDKVPRHKRPYAVGKAIRQLAEQDIGSARRWFESIKSVPGAFSEFAESELLRGWAVGDPESALEWLLENSKEQSLKRSYLMPFILREIAEVDPERAAKLAQEHGVRFPR